MAGIIDLEHIRQVTAQARQRASEETERIRKEGQEQAEAQKLMIELKALEVMSQIPSRMETEAKLGRDHAILMSVESVEYERPRDDRNWNTCEPGWLKGTSKLVYQYCEESELKPTIESWHDGYGMDGGFNIVIHWA